MSASIYHDEIKRLASQARGTSSLPEPHGRACLDSALCGDRVGVEVVVSEGRITALATQVKGCLLCRAAAAVVDRDAPGSGREDIELVIDRLTRMLEKGEPLTENSQSLAMFAPVHGHRSRYGCVLLPFRTLLAALEATD